MRVILSIHFWKGKEYDHQEPHEVLFRVVHWDAIPRPREILMYGVNPDGERQDINAYVNSVYWSSSGEVSVDCVADNCAHEYETLKHDAIRDGFLSHKEAFAYED